MYGSRSEDVAPLGVFLNPNCIPMDGATRIVSMKNSLMSLTSNPDKDRYSQLYSEYGEGSDRTEIFIYENNYHENIVDSIYDMVNIILQPNAQIFFNNNTFVGVSSLYG